METILPVPYISRRVSRAARHYAIIHPWADQRDLEQQAWLIVLDALSTYDASRNEKVSFAGYVWRALCWGLAAYLVHLRSPASGHGGTGTRRLRETSRAPIEVVEQTAAAEAADSIDDQIDRDRARARLREILREMGAERPELREAIEQHRREEEPCEAAQRACVERKEIYRRGFQLRDRLAERPEVWQLMEAFR